MFRMKLSVVLTCVLSQMGLTVKSDKGQKKFDSSCFCCTNSIVENKSLFEYIFKSAKIIYNHPVLSVSTQPRFFSHR